MAVAVPLSSVGVDVDGVFIGVDAGIGVSANIGVRAGLLAARLSVLLPLLPLMCRQAPRPFTASSRLV